MPSKAEYDLIEAFNAPATSQRLDALRQWRQQFASVMTDAVANRDVNNHIHTQYSFSPYSPTKAAWMAMQAGLATAGIMDHDTIAGAREFIEAGRILGLPTTIGAESRVSYAGTPFAGRRNNNPDQDTIAYVTMHGVPHSQIDAVANWFKPVLRARGKRNHLMTERLNGLLQPAGLTIDYDQDVIPLSMAHDGGQITERHLLFAVAQQLIKRFVEPAQLLAFLENTLRVPVRSKTREQLSDPHNPHLAYDLLGVLKSDLVDKFYIEATDECPPVSELVDFASSHGIILAYAYLGDVTDSVTGDKKAQAFEDAYLEDLISHLKDLGFHGVTYMPSRNTRDQLLRLRSLCERYELFQISGEDINQPRQKFVCEAMRDPLFENLYDAAWALIGHELLATENLEKGLFATPSCKEEPALPKRVRSFRDLAMRHYHSET